MKHLLSEEHRACDGPGEVPDSGQEAREGFRADIHAKTQRMSVNLPEKGPGGEEGY